MESGQSRGGANFLECIQCREMYCVSMNAAVLVLRSSEPSTTHELCLPFFCRHWHGRADPKIVHVRRKDSCKGL